VVSGCWWLKTGTGTGQASNDFQLAVAWPEPVPVFFAFSGHFSQHGHEDKRSRGAHVCR
jgi:hypothetical protein